MTSSLNNFVHSGERTRGHRQKTCHGVLSFGVFT